MRWQLPWLAGLALAEIGGLVVVLIWLGEAGVRGGYILIGISMAALVIFLLFVFFEGIARQ